MSEKVLRQKRLCPQGGQSGMGNQGGGNEGNEKDFRDTTTWIRGGI